jgi:hypothetical protein
VQPVGVGEQADVVLDHLVRELRRGLDGELVAEVEILPPHSELLVQLVEPVDGDVPELVVQRLGEEEGWLGNRPRGSGNLREGHPFDAVRVVSGQRVADRESGVGADHGEPLVAERVHERDQVVGERAGVVPGVPGLVGQPDAALVGHE